MLIGYNVISILCAHHSMHHQFHGLKKALSNGGVGEDKKRGLCDAWISDRYIS